AVGEGIGADDGFVARDREAAHVRDKARSLHDLAEVHAGMKPAKDVSARADGHHEFLKRRVAGAFADAVDCAFDLAGAALNGSNRVRDREPKVIVTMRAEDDVLRTARI